MTGDVIRRLSSGTAQPVLVADFQPASTAPRLSTMLSDCAGERPVYQIDPVSALSGERLYIPIDELAAACTDDFLSSAPSAGRVFVVGHCSASVLSLRIAGLLTRSRPVSVVLVQPTWPDDEHVLDRFAEFQTSLGGGNDGRPDLGGAPDIAVSRMEQALSEQLLAVARGKGLSAGAEVFGELLRWYRAWLAFLLACSLDLESGARDWAGEDTDITVLTDADGAPAVPGRSEGGYQVIEVPLLDREPVLSPELAEYLLAHLASSSW
jgi:hypothetical protein